MAGWLLYSRWPKKALALAEQVGFVYQKSAWLSRVVQLMNCQTLLTLREIGPAGIPSGAKHRREAGDFGEICSLSLQCWIVLESLKRVCGFSHLLSMSKTSNICKSGCEWLIQAMCVYMIIEIMAELKQNLGSTK